MNEQLTRRAALAVMGGVLLPSLSAARPLEASRLRASVSPPPPTNGPSNGPLVVLNARGGLGDKGPIQAIILTVQHNRATRVLARGLPYPFTGGLAPSPLGESLTYGADDQGLWIVQSNGTANHRLLLPPHSTGGIPLTIGPVAWSPDHSTLAFASFFSGDVGTAREQRVGIWLTSPTALQPRLLASNAQLGATDSKGNPFAIDRLSWSPDGRALAVSTYRSTSSGQPTPAILWVTVATGKARVLIPGGSEAAFGPAASVLSSSTLTSSALSSATLSTAMSALSAQSPSGLSQAIPVSPALSQATLSTSTPISPTLFTASAGYSLAYITGDPTATEVMTLIVSGPTKISAPIRVASKMLSSPVWSPDGQFIAYITDHQEIDVFNLTTRKTSKILTASQGRQPLLLPGGRFVRLAWLPASS